MKQRNFEDLMYDMQSLQEKNGRLKDRVRVVITGGSAPPPPLLSKSTDSTWVNIII